MCYSAGVLVTVAFRDSIDVPLIVLTATIVAVPFGGRSTVVLDSPLSSVVVSNVFPFESITFSCVTSVVADEVSVMFVVT